MKGSNMSAASTTRWSQSCSLKQSDQGNLHHQLEGHRRDRCQVSEVEAGLLLHGSQQHIHPAGMKHTWASLFSSFWRPSRVRFRFCVPAGGETGASSSVDGLQPCKCPAAHLQVPLAQAQGKQLHLHWPALGHQSCPQECFGAGEVMQQGITS